MFEKIKRIARLVANTVFSVRFALIAVAVAVSLIDYVPQKIGLCFLIAFVAADQVAAIYHKNAALEGLAKAFMAVIGDVMTGHSPTEADIQNIITSIKAI